jgi:hypothetical protein
MRQWFTIPADVTVDSGSSSREVRKDIKNGTRFISLIAFKALFEVSLISLSATKDKKRIILTTDTRG